MTGWPFDLLLLHSLRGLAGGRKFRLRNRHSQLTYTSLDDFIESDFCHWICMPPFRTF
jgi:hypothetical protein